MRILSFLAVCSFCLSSSRAEIVLVDRGQSDFAIVLSPEGTRAGLLAARELRRFIRKSTGAELEILKTPREGKPHVFVGPNEVSARAGIEGEDLPAEGFHLKTAGRDIHIVGHDTQGNPQRVAGSNNVQTGTLSGVYEFLERCAGVMFCWHDDLGTIVPKHERLLIPDLDVKDAPDWDYRMLAYSPEGQAGKLFGRRLRLGHPLTFSHGHAWYRILPIEKYGKEHPEYFAEIDGKRRARYYLGHHGGQVCTSNADVVKIFAEAAIEYFNKLSFRDMFSVSPNDGGGFCQCTNCRVLDSGELRADGAPVMTDRMITFYNAIAEHLVKVHPKKYLGAYIYSYYRRPPKRVKPHHNLVLVHATNSAFAQGDGWEEETKWEQAWSRLTPRYYKYDIYYYPRFSLNLIAPVTSHLIDKIKAEHENGVRGGYLYMGQSYEQLGAGHYLLSKLMWDKKADARALEKRYYKALYGNAALLVMAYYQLLEEQLKQVYTGKLEGTSPALARRFSQRKGRKSDVAVAAAHWPIMDRASTILEEASRQKITNNEKLRLQRLRDQHALMLHTVRGLAAALRLEKRGGTMPRDAEILKQSVQKREDSKKRIRNYAPTLADYIQRSDKAETALISPSGAFYQLATRERLPIITALRTEAPREETGLAELNGWRRAPLHYFLMTKSASQPSLGARAAVMFDDSNLFVHVEGREPAPSKVLKNANGMDDTGVFSDDNIEIFLKPPGAKGYFQIALGVGGGRFDASYPSGDPTASDPNWSPPLKTEVAATETGWAAWVSIPFASLGKDVKPEGDWRMNIYRTRRGNVEPDEYTAVAPTFGGYHLPQRFAQLRFVSKVTGPALKHSTFDSLRKEFVRDLRFYPREGATISIDTTRVWCGKQSVHVNVPKGGIGAITLSSSAEPDKSYRAQVAFFGKTTSLNPKVRPETPITRVIFRKTDGKAVTPTTGYSWKGSPALEKQGAWNTHTHIFKTPPGTEKISWTIFLHHPGDYWLDEVRLEEL
ncbi:MAG: DUF4838 domain-containing protein [Planctomycetota bacterium]|nr:DUF4838 domain-containing protein [Planctomycetota bacterium]